MCISLYYYSNDIRTLILVMNSLFLCKQFTNKAIMRWLKKDNIYLKIVFVKQKNVYIFASAFKERMCFIGEMAERSNAAVLKTVDCNRSGGSNPSFSASRNTN